MVELQLHYPFTSTAGLKLHGSCNGLLCLTYADFSVVLWNPCINKHWQLPLCHVRLGNDRKEGRTVCYGFGYDETTDDYKVVRLVEQQIEIVDQTTIHHQEVKVYSLKSNSWKSHPPLVPYYVRKQRCPGAGVLANSSVHWITRNHDYYGCEVIVGIDLRTERHHIVPHPPGMEGKEWDVGVLDGCLCVLSESHSFDLWIMDEYGVKESCWRKVFRIVKPDWDDRLRPIAYSNGSRKKIVFQGSDGVMWFDTEERGLESVEATSLFDYCEPASLKNGCYFVGSLVKPFGGGNTTSSADKRSGTKRPRKDSSWKRMMMETSSRTTASTLRRSSRMVKKGRGYEEPITGVDLVSY